MTKEQIRKYELLNLKASRDAMRIAGGWTDKAIRENTPSVKAHILSVAREAIRIINRNSK